MTITFFTITYSNQVMESVTFSISIWRDNLFPSLFPFFILSNCLLQYDFAKILGRIFESFMRKFFRLPGETSFVWIISLFSGFPSGAKYTTELVKTGYINQEQASKLLTFTHYSNPLFVLGMIGGILLNHKGMALLILFGHILSNVIVGFIFRPKDLSISKNKSYEIDKEDNKTFGNVLRQSIYDALQTMFLLLGIITIFLIVTTILEQLFDFDIYIKTVVAGLLEMTQGVKLASGLPISLLEKALLMTGFISFGGLSVHIQVLSIIGEAKIKYKYFLLARILHVLLACSLVLIFYYLAFNL